MKKINQKLLRNINKCIALILSFLGIASCDNPINNTLCMYGVPLNEFHISGRIENELGKGISGIKISSGHQEPLDTTNTDGSFNFTVHETTPFGIDLIIQDIDSTQNGYYKTKIIHITETENLVITLEEEKDNNE